MYFKMKKEEKGKGPKTQGRGGFGGRGCFLGFLGQAPGPQKKLGWGKNHGMKSLGRPPALEFLGNLGGSKGDRSPGQPPIPGGFFPSPLSFFFPPPKFLKKKKKGKKIYIKIL